jgi:MSHA pilin protein MshA
MGKTVQRGFTLIELVVVIVILGILAAFAVPRFMGLENQARVATVTAMRGSISSVASMVYGLAMAQGVAGTANSTVTLSSGGTIPTHFGYPANTAFSTPANLVALIQDTSAFTVTTVGGNVLFEKIGASALATCAASYAQPAAAGALPTIQYGTGSMTLPTPANC